MLTKNDLKNIGKLFAEEFPKAFEKEFPKAFEKEFPKAFEKEFPKAFEKAFPVHFKKAFEGEYPRLRSEMYETVASAIDTYISPQFDDIRESQKDIEDFLGVFYRETKVELKNIKNTVDENFLFAVDEDVRYLKKYNKGLKELENKLVNNNPAEK